MRLLISGSRDSTLAMTDYARRCVFRASIRGHSIIVGDAPGIDTHVVIACRLYNVPCEIYGITAEPRCTRQVEAYGIVMKYPAPMPPYVRHDGDFYSRDLHMVGLAEMVMVVWNGSSIGSKRVFDYACELGKTAHLRTFNQ